DGPDDGDPAGVASGEADPPAPATSVGAVVGLAPSTPRVGRKPPPRVSARIETEITKIAAASDGRRPGRPSPTARVARRGRPTGTGATKAKPHDGQSPRDPSQQYRHA